MKKTKKDQNKQQQSQPLVNPVIDDNTARLIAEKFDLRKGDKGMQTKLWAHGALLKSVDVDRRAVFGVGTTLAVDREGEVIVPRAFEKSVAAKPRDTAGLLMIPMSWSHFWGDPPVARVVDVQFTDTEMPFEGRFADEGSYEFADVVYRLYEQRILNDFSVGFIPVTTSNEHVLPMQTGVTHIEAELLEIACVTIPCNPEARQRMLKMLGGMDRIDRFLKAARAEEAMELFGDGGSVHIFGGTGKDAQPPEPATVGTETKPGFEETENEVRYRVRDPELFEQFRYIDIKKDKPRVKAVYGKYKGKDEWAIQALRFPKEDGWTIEKAKEWVKDNPDVIKSFSQSEFIALLVSLGWNDTEAFAEIRSWTHDMKSVVPLNVIPFKAMARAPMSTPHEPVSPLANSGAATLGGGTLFAHHAEIEGQLKTVWRAVVVAMRQLLLHDNHMFSTEMFAEVYEHLASEYKHFGKQPPVITTIDVKEFVAQHLEQKIDLSWMLELDVSTLVSAYGWAACSNAVSASEPQELKHVREAMQRRDNELHDAIMELKNTYRTFVTVDGLKRIVDAERKNILGTVLALRQSGRL